MSQLSHKEAGPGDCEASASAPAQSASVAAGWLSEGPCGCFLLGLGCYGITYFNTYWHYFRKLKENYFQGCPYLLWPTGQ